MVMALLLPLANKLTVGAGAGLTFTVTLLLAVPPGPVHCSVYVCVVVNAPVDCVPLPAVEPDHPPDAVHVVLLLFVLVLVQESVAAELYAIVIALLVLFACKVTVGGCTGGGAAAAKFVFKLRMVAIAVTE